MSVNAAEQCLAKGHTKYASGNKCRCNRPLDHHQPHRVYTWTAFVQEEWTD